MVFYDKSKNAVDSLKNTLFLEMKNYSLGYYDERFHTEVIEKAPHLKFYTLYRDNESLYILVPLSSGSEKEITIIPTPSGSIVIPFSNSATQALKIWYPISLYERQRHDIMKQMAWYFVLFELLGMVLSLIAAWYTLYPLRTSLNLLEDFIKDIIHDLNTPLASIMLNLKMAEDNEEIRAIKTAAHTIEMLHHNLDSYLNGKPMPKETFDVKELTEKYIDFFMPMYDYLQWNIDLHSLCVHADKQAFGRIVYNILNNACKYNTSQGSITIRIIEDVLVITNNSYGVANPEKVFERFYKESEKGLGIGLHIVDKLTRMINIEKNFTVEGDDVTVTLDCRNIRTPCT
jgi:two-component system OmpR family sensor kinase